MNFTVLHKYIFAFVFGLTSSFSLPPFGLFFLMPMGFIGLLLLLIYSHTKKEQFVLGYIFGFGHFLFSLNWIKNALMVEADKFEWLKPFALIGIPAILAIYIGCVAVISSMVRHRRVLLCWTFSITWTLCEILRSYFIFPFPWNLLGYASYVSNVISQFASVIGVYGLSFMLVMFSTVFITKSFKAIMSCIMMFIFIYSFGYYRLSNQSINNSEKLKVRIIHYTPTKHHFGDQDEWKTQIDDMIYLSNAEYQNTPDFIVWPEAVLPFKDSSMLIPAVMGLLPQGSWLISGADRVQDELYQTKYYNSMLSISSNGDIKSVYDKHILVPFGEYIPARWMFPSLIQKIAYGIGDFSVGEKYQLLEVNGKYAIPLICYEAIFTFFLNKFAIDKANMIINVTNDSWFGDSIGPKQHFEMVKFRAIEYGLPLIRAANGGISSVVNRYGIESISTGSKQNRALDVDVYIDKVKSTFYHENLLSLQILFCAISFITYSFIFFMIIRKHKA